MIFKFGMKHSSLSKTVLYKTSTTALLTMKMGRLNTMTLGSYSMNFNTYPE